MAQVHHKLGQVCMLEQGLGHKLGQVLVHKQVQPGQGLELGLHELLELHGQLEELYEELGQP